MKIVLAVLLPTLSWAACNNPQVCIDSIRRIVTEHRQFWFGEQWKFMCTGKQHRRPADCYNPNELCHFYSVGNRLFRVKTYQAGYLQNLKIFPKITFRPHSGTYRACDHDFAVNEQAGILVEAGFDLPPIQSFRSRNLPEITWQGMNNGNSYIVLIIDIGFGTLNYLALGYPKNTQVLKEYVPSENFRPVINPVAVLIFEQPRRLKHYDVKMQSESQLFDLPRFMLENSLENGLIGLNLILVSYDAYAIERQRIRAVADNCHFLIEQKLQRDVPWEFVRSFPLLEMDSWLSVEYEQPESSTFVCCKKLSNRKSSIPLDPLENGRTPSVAVHSPPSVSSLKIPQNEVSYQRNARDFIGFASLDQLHTLILFDPEMSSLHWMITDIPTSSIAIGNINDGILVSPYLVPIPQTPKACSSYVYMLFVQPRSNTPSPISRYYNVNHTLRSSSCRKNCSERASFDVREFKSYHQLRLAAINWMNVCYDLHEAKRQISKLSLNFTQNAQSSARTDAFDQSESKDTLKSSFKKRYIGEAENSLARNPETEICAAMGLPTDGLCKDSSLPHQVSFTVITACLSVIILCR